MDEYDKAYKVICKRLKSICILINMNFKSFTAIKRNGELYLGINCTRDNPKADMNIAVCARHECQIDNVIADDLSQHNVLDIILDKAKSNNVIVLDMHVIVQMGETLESLCIEYDMKAGML